MWILLNSRCRNTEWTWCQAGKGKARLWKDTLGNPSCKKPHVPVWEQYGSRLLWTPQGNDRSWWVYDELHVTTFLLVVPWGRAGWKPFPFLCHLLELLSCPFLQREMLVSSLQLLFWQTGTRQELHPKVKWMYPSLTGKHSGALLCLQEEIHRHWEPPAPSSQSLPLRSEGD